MKYILRPLLVVCILLQLVPISANADGAYYLVSAYYSPVEWQAFYLHGSYEEEVKMNGEGVTTASNQPVRIGIVAAPREIPFNTRVHIKQTLTIKGTPVNFDFHGSVLDRGGAIHSAANLPRLDVYMGKGLEGLCRAINFGVQTVYVELDNDATAPDTNNFDAIPSDCSNPNTEIVPLSSGTKQTFNPFTMSIGPGSPIDNIKVIQKLLTRVNSYSGPIDGLYDEKLMEAIFQFQKNNGIVKERSDDGAGNYGPKTRAMLQELLKGELNKISNLAIVNDTGANTTTSSGATTTASSQSNQSASTIMDITGLQTKLRDLGYYKYDIDGIHNKRLVDALYAFQLDKKIVTDENDPGAGYFGPVTKTAIDDLYAAYLARKEAISKLEREIEIVKNTQTEVREKKRLEFLDMMAKIPQVKLNAVHPEIRTLQKILKDLGYLSVKDTAIFGSMTKKALAKYQLKLGVIDSLNSKYAWIIGDKTREAIANDLYERWLPTDTASDTEIKRLTQELEAMKKG